MPPSVLRSLQRPLHNFTALSAYLVAPKVRSFIRNRPSNHAKLPDLASNPTKQLTDLRALPLSLLLPVLLRLPSLPF